MYRTFAPKCPLFPLFSQNWLMVYCNWANKMQNLNIFTANISVFLSCVVIDQALRSLLSRCQKQIQFIFFVNPGSPGGQTLMCARLTLVYYSTMGSFRHYPAGSSYIREWSLLSWVGVSSSPGHDVNAWDKRSVLLIAVQAAAACLQRSGSPKKKQKHPACIELNKDGSEKLPLHASGPVICGHTGTHHPGCQWTGQGALCGCCYSGLGLQQWTRSKVNPLNICHRAIGLPVVVW